MDNIFESFKTFINLSDGTNQYLSLNKLKIGLFEEIETLEIVNQEKTQESIQSFDLDEKLIQNISNFNSPEQSQISIESETDYQDNSWSLLKLGFDNNLLKQQFSNRSNKDLKSTYNRLEQSFDSIESSTTTVNDNHLLAQNFGWVGNENNTNLHRSAIAQLQCSCPACYTNNLLTNGSKNGKLESQAVTASSLGDYQIDGILSDYQWEFSWGNRQLSYSFYEDTVFNGSYSGRETGVKEVSEGIKNNVRSIMNWIENIINIDFVEVTETANNYGRMRFMLSDNPGYAYAYYPSNDNLASVAGDVHLKSKYDYSGGDGNGFQNSAGKHGYMSLIHEIGHTLGLKHPHDDSPTLPAADDNTTNTVMTYNFTGNSAGTFMPYDIKALQSIYGAKDYNLGNNTYQFTKVDQFSLNGQLSLNTTFSTKQAIWDSGGIDILDFSALSANSSGYRFDLNPGGILSTKTAYNGTSYSENSVTYKTTTFGTAIAYNVSIENLVNSISNDEIFANNAANRFSGYSSLRATGNDILWNTNSQDTLDLSGYNSPAVSQTQNGNDLVLGFGSKGSVTVKNYYVGEKINLLFGDTFNLSINNVTTPEGNIGTTTSLFTVVLSGSNTQTVTVAYNTADGTAIKGQDYLSTNGMLTFAPGETQKSIAVEVLGNLLNSESSKTFFVNLSSVTGNAKILNGQGTGTIIEDDFVPTFSLNDFTVNEGDGNAIFTVSLSSASTQIVSVNYSTTNGLAIAGQDYTATNGTLTFNPGEISKTISVAIKNDTVYEINPETFFLNLSNAKNATITDAQGVGTIKDNESLPIISINNVNRQEETSTNPTDTTNFKFTVSLSNASTQAVTVQYATANDTAIAGSDYLAKNGLLTFNPGETSKTLTVKVYADTVVEQNENFFVNLTNPTKATIGDAQGLGTITNDDATTASKSKPNQSLSVAQKDILTGVASSQAIAVDQSVAIFKGSNDADSFVLGEMHQAYYTQAGANDYALISDFNQGDVIQLHGKAAAYQLAASSGGTAIFRKTSDVEELIGIVQGVASLNLESSAFSFI